MLSSLSRLTPRQEAEAKADYVLSHLFDVRGDIQNSPDLCIYLSLSDIPSADIFPPELLAVLNPSSELTLADMLELAHQQTPTYGEPDLQIILKPRVDLALAQRMNRTGPDGLLTQKPSIYFSSPDEDYRHDPIVFPTNLDSYRLENNVQDVYCLYDRPTTDQIIRHILIHAYLNDVRVYDIAGDTIIIPPEAMPKAIYESN
jgi:hypothetical protein